MNLARCAFLVAVLASVPGWTARGAAAIDTSPAKPRVLRDIVWAWGNPEMTQPGDHTAATYAEASPVQRAGILGASNIFMAGHGLPDDAEEAERLTEEVSGLKRMVWEIGPDGPPGPPFVYEKRMALVRRLADKYPALEGVLLDDMSTIGIDRGFKPEHIGQIRALLPGEYGRLKIWGVVYTMSLDREGINEYLEALDVILLAVWHAEDVVNLEEYVARCERLFPAKPIVLGLYLYDYGADRPMPRELLVKQCEIARALAHAGRIEGIEFTTITNDAETVAWTADWLKRTGDEELGAAQSTGALQVEKLYFMFHPVCWAMGMQGDEPPAVPEGATREDYLACLEWEKAVNKRQKDFISGMKASEALIMFPISGCAAMLDLERHATEVLGNRCIFVREVHSDPPAAWRELADPIREFVENETLPGKEAYLADVPSEVRGELLAEVREACAARGYDWSLGGLEVTVTSRMLALDIARQLAANGLSFDPATVQCEAFGEGFEQCAMTWKAMVAPYLGMANPAPNIFDLSVSGARFLVDATFRERIALDHDIYLYLWEGADTQPIGLFARAWCRLADPQYHVYLPFNENTCEVWTEEAYGKRAWPADASPVTVLDGRLVVPVFSGIRRDPTDGAFYIMGKGIAFDDFKQQLLESEIR